MMVRVSFLAVFALSVSTGNFTAQQKQDKEEKKAVRRVKRPDFTDKDWDGIFFENLFEEGLVGPRPEKSELVTKEAPSGADDSTSVEIPEQAWSQYISRDAIEDEIKLLHRQLQSSITTPSRFNSEFRDVRQQFSMLSLLFAIIREYDQDIRWKKYAASAQVAFAEATVKARQPSKPAFENSKQRKLDLDELIRGGTIPINSDLPDRVQWPDVIDRRAMMVRLENALQDVLKPAIASEDEFQENIDRVKQEAEIVSALGQALVQDGMDEADDDGYREFAVEMRTAARRVVRDAANEDFQAVSKAVNLISQSCTDCHGVWR